MATDLERLVVQLSADFKQFERQMARAEGVTNRQFRAIENRARQMNRNLDGILKSTASRLVAPLAGVGALLGGAELIRLTDTWTDLTSRVNLAAGSMEAGTEVMGRLGEMARRTYSSLEQTTESYIANNTALRELGYSTGQQLDYTEALNNALVISAAKGDRAAAIQNALAKAMAGGKLAGDDLNTVIQQGGRVAEALAAGLGVGVNQLRKLGAEGKITSREVFRALTSQMETLRREAESMPATISDGVQLLRNALLEYVGNADQATGVSRNISDALVIMADNFDTTADVALQLAAVIAGALVGRSLLRMISTLGLAGTALINFTRALSAARTMAGLTVAMSGLSAAAGPVGLLIGGALVSSLVLYSNATADAAAASRTYEEALEAVRAKASEASDAVANAAAEIDDKTANMLSRGVEQGAAEIERLTKSIVDEIANAIVTFENLSSLNLVSDSQLDELRALKVGLEDGSVAADDAEQRLYSLANINVRFQTVADRISTITRSLLEAVAATDLLRSKLDAPSRAIADAYQQYGSSRSAGNAIQAEREAYEQAAIRRAQLGRAQLDLENEIARVRQQAERDNVQLTEDQIKRIAEANLAGNASRSAEGRKGTKERADEYQRLAERIREATASLVAETEVQRQLNPLIDDYGYAMERARVEHELLNAAKKAGVPITAELRGEIANLAEQYAVATVEAAKLAEEQNRARENAEHWLGVGQNVTKGFIDDLIRGTSAAGAFANAISKIGDALINDVLSNIFKINQAGSGGILGSIIGLIGGSIGGGVRLPGMAPIPTPRPMLGASMAAPMSSPLQAPTMPNLSAMKAAAKPQELRVLVVAEEGPMLRPVISATSRDVAVKVTQVGLDEFSRGAGRAMVLDAIEDPRKRG